MFRSLLENRAVSEKVLIIKLFQVEFQLPDGTEVREGRRFDADILASDTLVRDTTFSLIRTPGKGQASSTSGPFSSYTRNDSGQIRLAPVRVESNLEVHTRRSVGRQSATVVDYIVMCPLPSTTFSSCGGNACTSTNWERKTSLCLRGEFSETKSGNKQNAYQSSETGIFRHFVAATLMRAGNSDIHQRAVADLRQHLLHPTGLNAETTACDGAVSDTKFTTVKYVTRWMVVGRPRRLHQNSILFGVFHERNDRKGRMVPR